MSGTHEILTEADILAHHVIVAGSHRIPPEVARLIADLRFDQSAIDRMNELAEMARREALTEQERSQLERFQRVGSFLNVLQAQARLSLNDPHLSTCFP